ncbi:type II toxin-antitoxin system HicA family toxin [Leminorella richardii]|nr:type II toxin-antitoxin system HicA family toxin [Leminorella richardii]
MQEKVLLLRKKQYSTLSQLFKIPALAGIKWKDIESLVIALGGEVQEGNGSRVKFFLAGSIAHFHRPHPSPDTDKGAVVSVGDWLMSLGVTP